MFACLYLISVTQMRAPMFNASFRQQHKRNVFINFMINAKAEIAVLLVYMLKCLGY